MSSNLHLDKLSKKDLEKLLRELGLPTTGLKKDMINRARIGMRDKKFKEIPRFPSTSIKLHEVIGKGFYGVVERGSVHGEEGFPENCGIVAVKSMLTPKQEEEIKEEANQLFRLKHDNIIKLLGIWWDNYAWKLVFEYMEKGNLESYLRKCRSLTTSNLLKFSQQIASGLVYMASMEYIHRDLATRNCLMDGNMNVKISDFGLSKDLGEHIYYRINKHIQLPVRWMAPESLNVRYSTNSNKSLELRESIFTKASDVWSYGILLWEIFTYGKIPWEEEQDLIAVAEKIKNKELLPAPDNCPAEIYNLMLKCWTYNWWLRPSMADVKEMLEEACNKILQPASNIPGSGIPMHSDLQTSEEEMMQHEDPAYSDQTNSPVDSSQDRYESQLESCTPMDSDFEISAEGMMQPEDPAYSGQINSPVDSSQDRYESQPGYDIEMDSALQISAEGIMPHENPAYNAQINSPIHSRQDPYESRQDAAID